MATSASPKVRSGRINFRERPAEIARAEPPQDRLRRANRFLSSIG